MTRAEREALAAKLAERSFMPRLKSRLRPPRVYSVCDCGRCKVCNQRRKRYAGRPHEDWKRRQTAQRDAEIRAYGPQFLLSCHMLEAAAVEYGL